MGSHLPVLIIKMKMIKWKDREMNMKNDHGFTLLEIVVATGLLAALSLGVVSLLQTMTKGQNTAETKIEELEIRRMITTVLTNKDACLNTLGGKSIGETITEIKNSEHHSMFETDKIYGNNTLKISAMKTLDLDQAFDDGTRMINLEVSFVKLKNISGNLKTTTVPIRVEAPSADGKITSCFADADSMIQKSCETAGGTWLGSSCSFPQYVLRAGDTMTTGTLADGTPGTGTLTASRFSGPLIGNVTGSLHGNVSGGAVSGTTATFTGDVTAPQICTGGNCKLVTDFALRSSGCPNGEVQIGVSATGLVLCKALQCPVGEFFAGLDNSGASICRPNPEQTCENGKFVNLVNEDGTVVCAPIPNSAVSACPAGQVMQSTTEGTSVCVPSAFDNTPNTIVMRDASGNFAAGTITASLAGNASSAGAAPWSGVTNKPTIPTATCPAGQFVKEITAAGAVICGLPQSQTCPSRMAGGMTGGSPLLITSWCDPGCYVTGFQARGGESSSCTATSASNISVDYIDYANVGAAGVYTSSNFDITVYEGTSYTCRTNSVRCLGSGITKAGKKPRYVEVQFSAIAIAGNCYANYVTVTCAHL